MGLTIHYALETKLTRPEDVRTLVSTLHSFAKDLPFQAVEDVVEFKNGETSHDDRDDPDRWLKIQAGQYVKDGLGNYRVSPVHVLAFTALPGEGCEPANFGLCRYPASVDVPTAHGRRRRLRTGLHGWSWGAFCKTQYASNPEHGGVENFLRCHLLVIRMPDFAKKTGLLDVGVNDESDYWEHRDVKKLASAVGEWNQFIAAFAGQLMDRAATNGTSIEAAILRFPDFEQLEARGLKQLERLRNGSNFSGSSVL